MAFLAIVLVVIFYSDSITITTLILLFCPYCGLYPGNCLALHIDRARPESWARVHVQNGVTPEPTQRLVNTALSCIGVAIGVAIKVIFCKPAKYIIDLSNQTARPRSN